MISNNRKHILNFYVHNIPPCIANANVAIFGKFIFRIHREQNIYLTSTVAAAE